MIRFWLITIPLALVASLFISMWFLWALAIAGACSFGYRMLLRSLKPK
jgi:hypothetical protein